MPDETVCYYCNGPCLIAAENRLPRSDPAGRFEWATLEFVWVCGRPECRSRNDAERSGLLERYERWSIEASGLRRTARLASRLRAVLRKRGRVPWSSVSREFARAARSCGT